MSRIITDFSVAATGLSVKVTQIALKISWTIYIYYKVFWKTINRFLPNVPFWSPWKYQRTFWFSVFRGSNGKKSVNEVHILLLPFKPIPLEDLTLIRKWYFPLLYFDYKGYLKPREKVFENSFYGIVSNFRFLVLTESSTGVLNLKWEF